MIFSYAYIGFHCEYPPSECQRLQQATSLSIQCTDPYQCPMNEIEKQRQITQLSTYTCRTERDRTLDTYFTCLHEHAHNHCDCPSSKTMNE
jgi:hypothetical protein